MSNSASRRSLGDWLQYLESLHPKTIELGLDRVRMVQERLGLAPAFPVIIVGGTNGKGSTCAFIESILRAQGYQTGLYTSPHLLRYNERIRINGREAGDAEIVAGMEAVDAAKGNVSLTYFEHGTLGAMWQFVQAKVEVTILEVGLGGRLDAVNIFEPAVSVVTSIDLDHQAWLGDSRESIGFEKAGIFRAGKAAVCGDTDPPQSLLDHAQGIGANLLSNGKDFFYEQIEGGWNFSMGETELYGLPMPALAGTHQLSNAASALAALSQLAEVLPISLSAIRDGIANAGLSGRFQRIHGAIEVVLDVAHNPESARALAANLRDKPSSGKNYAVFALLADKDASGVIEPLKQSFDAWFVAGLAGERGQPGEVLAAQVRQCVKTPVSVHEKPLSAYQAARLQAVEGDRITIFGSFHTVAEVLPDATTSR